MIASFSFLKTNRFPSIVLVASVVLGFFLSMIGANWGRVECWNLDQMAFRGVKHNGLPYGGYLKPPLVNYTNHLLILKPIKGIRHQFTQNIRNEYPYQLMGVRLLTIALFCGMIIILYGCVQRASGDYAAGVISLLAATSAGLLEFNHFGTADSPLLFWMTASLAMALRTGLTGRLRDSIFAGLLAGLATADKYNGLGIAIAVPVSLITGQGLKSILRFPFWAGCLAVPLGFIIGCPGVIFETHNFVTDFLYNLYTTPVYSGDVHHSGYVDFLLCIPNLIGWPATLLVVLALASGIWLTLNGKQNASERFLITSSSAVALFYYLSIGRFPRMADRFVLPAIPLLLLMAAPGLAFLGRFRHSMAAALIFILGYNIASSIELGMRFLSDPRMAAQRYAESHFPKGSVIENTYAPDWNRLPSLDVTVHVMPYATGRSDRFKKLFGENSVVAEGIEKYEVRSYPEDTFTKEGLERRHPDFIAFSNQAYQFTGDDQAQRFYRDLDDGKLGYSKVFDQTWKARAPWSYPHDIDFLAERMIILKRVE